MPVWSSKKHFSNQKLQLWATGDNINANAHSRSNTNETVAPQDEVKVVPIDIDNGELSYLLVQRPHATRSNRSGIMGGDF